MFKLDNFEDELLHSMEKQLVSAQVESKYGFNKLAKAVEYLNASAAIFEQAGMLEQAAEITEVLQKLANELSETLPDDYESCSMCGFDHTYEPEESRKAHLKEENTFSVVNNFGELVHYRAIPTGNGEWQLFVILEDDSGKYPEEEGELISSQKLREMKDWADSHKEEYESALIKLIDSRERKKNK